MAADRWSGGDDYESYVGRWSRRVAEQFIDWLDVPAGRSWVDVGCGTGALTDSITVHAAPASVVAVDRSADFVAHAARAIDDRRVVFLVGDAASLPLADAHVDAVVSGLVLNFLPDPGAAVEELRRVTRPGGTVAAYVWDYAEGMQPIRAFWDAAIELAPAAGELDEAVRFPLCEPDRLRDLFAASGLERRERAQHRRRGDVPRLRRLLDALPERRRAGARLLRLSAGGSARGAPRPPARPPLPLRRPDRHEHARLRSPRHSPATL